MLEKIKRLQPNNFTMAIGAYSHGLTIPLPGADLILVTGQIAMDSKGQAVAPNDTRSQTEFIFNNISTILAEAGATMSNVVKATIFITSMDYFPQVSEVRNKYFENSKPVSTLVEVSKLSKEGCDVEIEVMAVVLK